MTDIPEALVEKAVHAYIEAHHHPPVDAMAAMRAALTAVWPDVAAARPVLLCSQCGEQPAAMVKVGTDDGWCVTCLDNAAEPEPPVVDRSALANALHPNWTRDETRGIVNAVLASGAVTDAADVRRQTAEDIAAAIEDRLPDPERFSASHIAREIGGADA